VFSALLNFRDGRWPPQPDGRYRTVVVRREKPEGEGPDDIRDHYGAELKPVVLETSRDGDTGQLAAEFDLSRFSSWARQDKPGRLLFSADRRPQRLTASLVLGTSLTVRLAGAA
jgi:hypothetical protein